MTDLNLLGASVPMAHKPSALLPITRYRQTILDSVDATPVTIVVGRTGSGKTTQLPQFLEQAGWCDNGKVVAVTQPRRLAVTTAAARVAEEMGCKVGDQVGFLIRFENATSASTRIKFLTDGSILREALVDPLLSHYSVIMVDEVHERSLNTDVLLGLLKGVIKQRPELRIIISSATIQAHSLVNFFEMNDKTTPRVISLDEQTFPVDISYTEESVENYVEEAVNTVFKIHEKETPGDILLFLTCNEEIEAALALILERTAQFDGHTARLRALPFYTGPIPRLPMSVFEPIPENARKVIISTDIAEASMKLENVTFVIDSGFVKLRQYDPNSGIESVALHPTSKDSAAQRASRAGHARPGKCFRLYTENTFNTLRESDILEIQRSNLAPTLLQLKAMGIENIADFEFITPPPSHLILQGIDLLSSLGALNNDGKLTRPFGSYLAELSIEPMLATALLSASNYGCLSEMLSIAAMVSQGGDVWSTTGSNVEAVEASRQKFAAAEGDHLTMLNVYTAFVANSERAVKWSQDHQLNYKLLQRAVSSRLQLKQELDKLGILAEDHTVKADIEDRAKLICKCLAKGYSSQAAKMQPDGSFKTALGGLRLQVHPSSFMSNRKVDWVIFQETIGNVSNILIKSVTSVEQDWLVQPASLASSKK